MDCAYFIANMEQRRRECRRRWVGWRDAYRNSLAQYHTAVGLGMTMTASARWHEMDYFQAQMRSVAAARLSTAARVIRAVPAVPCSAGFGELGAALVPGVEREAGAEPGEKL